MQPYQEHGNPHQQQQQQHHHQQHQGGDTTVVVVDGGGGSNDSRSNAQHDAALRTLLTGYRCMAPIKQLIDTATCQADIISSATASNQWHDVEQHNGQWWCSFDFQTRLFNEVLNDSVVRMHPPSSSYRHRFVRTIVQQIEEANEVHTHNSDINMQCNTWYCCVIHNLLVVWLHRSCFISISGLIG
jgi:hypothetical protein